VIIKYFADNVFGVAVNYGLTRAKKGLQKATDKLKGSVK